MRKLLLRTLCAPISAFFASSVARVPTLGARFAVLSLAGFLGVILALGAVRFLVLLVLDLVEARVIPLIFRVRLAEMLLRTPWRVVITLAAISSLVVVLLSVLVLTVTVVSGCVASARVTALRGTAATPFCRILLASGLCISPRARWLTIIIG